MDISPYLSRDENQQLLLGIRRANRQPTNLSSSVLSSDSMHIGILAAAAHAAANNSPFTVFYNPRASPSEFVIPLAKYYIAVCSNQISLGMRFRMMFETEESGTRRYMGTITGISDLDPARWKNSQWQNLQVGWDESTGWERRTRVSIWEIEPVTAPFFICPTPFFRPKRPRQPGMAEDESADLDNLFKRNMPWLGEDMSAKDPGLSLIQWMNMQQSSTLSSPLQPNYMNTLSGPVLQNYGQSKMLTQYNLQFNNQRSIMRFETLQKLLPQATIMRPLATMMQPQQQLTDPSQQLIQQNLNNSQNQVQSQVHAQQPSSMQNHHLYRNLQQQQQQFQQQQRSLLAQQSAPQQSQDRQKPLEDVGQSQSLSRSISTSQTIGTPPQTPLSQQHISRNNSQGNIRFSHLSQQPKLHPTNQILTNGSSVLTGTVGGGGPSGITDDVPSCSTSPSANNFPTMVPSVINGRSYTSTTMGGDEILTHTGVDSQIVSAKVNFVNSSSLVNVSKSQNQGFLPPVTYLNNINGTHMDFLENLSSATSNCVPQNELHLQHQNPNQLSSKLQQDPLRDTIHDDPRTEVLFGVDI